jgi:serine/threonine protein kinase
VAAAGNGNVNLQVEKLLDLASELPMERRADFLVRECPDPQVRAEVESLLEYATDTECYFNHAIQSVAWSLRTTREASPGDAIGPYRIVSLIGRGGMGSVYLAERADGEIQQRVAVKLLRTDGHRPVEPKRFLQERQLLASLHHPSIVHVIDAGHTSDGRPFLIMEHVDGVPIDVYAAQIDLRDRLKLFIRVCEGVSHAHRRLVIHRDLKPSNILVDTSGQPKLLDFGIAKLLDETSGDATQTVERLLTPNYASPEQLAGEAQTTATDVYSLGAVLYKLLAGVGPRENTPGAPKTGVAPPSHLNPDVPKDLDFIVGKALRAEPDERYTSVDEFASDVRAALDWRPVQARSGDVWYRARRFLRRYWVPATAAALVVASLSTGLFIANRQRVLAERRFGQLRQLANKVMDLDRAIRILPGSVDARQRLVSASLEYLEGLAPEARGNLDLAQEIGEGYWRLGRIQGVNAEFNLGDPAKAEDSLKKADALTETVLADRPQDRSALFRSAVIAHDRMILADTDKRTADTMFHIRRAVERLENFQRHEDPRDPVRLEGFLRPGDPRQSELSGVALLYVNIALTYVNMHMYADGVRYAQRAVELTQSIPSARDLTGGGLSVLANALRYQGDLDAALKTIREARRISETATYPSQTARLFNRYGPLYREGLILGEEDAVNLGRPGEAIEAFQKGLDMVEEATRKDLSDAASRTRVGTVARELGNVLLDRDPQRSLAVYEQGIHRLEETRNRLEARRDRAVLLAKSSYPLRRLRRFAEAKARIDAAFVILKDTKDYPAERIRTDGHAYKAVRALADYEAEMGDPRQALKMYQQLLDKVMASKPDPFGDLRETPKISRIYEALAVLYRRTGDAAAADAMNARRVELWRSWQQKLPQNAFVRRQLEAGVKVLK